jgi:hypothetical protein
MACTQSCRRHKCFTLLLHRSFNWAVHSKTSTYKEGERCVRDDLSAPTHNHFTVALHSSHDYLLKRARFSLAGCIQQVKHIWRPNRHRQ